MTYQSFLFVGCGNMGGAMLDGWLASGIDPSVFTISDPYRDEAPDGVTLVKELPQRQFDAVLLGVKPNMLADVAPDIARVLADDSIVFSVLAGTELATIQRLLPGAGAHVRVMPNLAAKLGKSPIALVGEGLDEAGREEVRQFYDRLGTAEWLADESLFNLVTALAGSGPGFVYRFIDALATGAADLGLPEDQARRLAVTMVDGASALAAGSDLTPAELADRVASPGGTTRAGMDVMDEGDRVLELMRDTLRAARDRGAAMAAETR